MGSKIKLSLGNKKPEVSTKVWKLDFEDESIDADKLLDDDDQQKPSLESLRVCLTTGKRKACKDCSCGLGEELEAEKNATSIASNPQVNSSCGSVSYADH